MISYQMWCFYTCRFIFICLYDVHYKIIWFFTFNIIYSQSLLYFWYYINRRWSALFLIRFMCEGTSFAFSQSIFVIFWLLKSKHVAEWHTIETYECMHVKFIATLSNTESYVMHRIRSLKCQWTGHIARSHGRWQWRIQEKYRVFDQFLVLER